MEITRVAGVIPSKHKYSVVFGNVQMIKNELNKKGRR